MAALTNKQDTVFLISVASKNKAPTSANQASSMTYIFGATGIGIAIVLVQPTVRPKGMVWVQVELSLEIESRFQVLHEDPWMIDCRIREWC